MTEEITQLLSGHDNNEPEAIKKLYSAIYGELHLIAHRQLKKSWDLDTICTTALVNEVYIKLIGYDKSSVNSRGHFFAVAAKAMRQIIVSYAEKKNAKKRGYGWHQVTNINTFEQPDQSSKTLLLVNSALIELEKVDTSLSRLVELRFYAGMTEEELAENFNVSTRTVRRNWKKAKAFLSREMKRDESY